MYLQRLELQGFKSFAQRTILEFPELSRGHKGITSIVGPNGSGKSNIADAIRWVLGEQSMKLLRAKKTEDIIFSGSEKKGRLSLAEVSLYLNNEDKKVPIDYLEIVITRRFYRDGTSEYLINKNSVRLHDVILLLAKAQFGQKSYSVIGQGMIDHILNATHVERKDFFYEATGVREFQLKKEQSLLKLSRTKENLKQVEITLHELEPHLRLLERHVKRLEQREEIKKELEKFQKQYYCLRWHEASEKIHGFQARSFEQHDECEAKEKELKKLKAELISLEGDESRSEHFVKLESEYQQLSDEKNSVSRELATAKGKLDLEYERTGQMNLVWLSKHHDEITQRIKGLESERQLLEDQLRRNECLINAKQEQRAEFETNVHELEATINQLRSKIIEYAEFSEAELNHDIEVIYQMQKNLVLRLEQIQEISGLDEIKKEASAVMEHTKRLYDKVKKSSKDVHSQEMFVFQQELNSVLLKKNIFLNELGGSEAQNRLFHDKIVHIEAEVTKLRKEQEGVVLEMSQTKDLKHTQNTYSEEMRQKQRELEQQTTTLEKRIAVLRNEMKVFNVTEEQKRQKMIQMQRTVQAKQEEVSRATEVANVLKVEFTREEVHREELEREIVIELADLSFLKDYELPETETRPSYETLMPQIKRLKHKLDLIGGIDEEAIQEYTEVKSRHEFLHNQYEDLMSALDSLQEVIHELEKKIDVQFHATFQQISEEFHKYFQILFGGGQASLSQVMEEVTDEVEIEIDAGGENETEELVPPTEVGLPPLLGAVNGSQVQKKSFEKVFSGIDIWANPPGKKVKHISALSGGEKALTSIALICAIIATNPSPFVVLDEVDAALDESNSEKFADIVEKLAHTTQFIVITHNRATMRRSHILYGVTAGHDGISHLLSIKLDEAERIVKQ